MKGPSTEGLPEPEGEVLKQTASSRPGGSKPDREDLNQERNPPSDAHSSQRGEDKLVSANCQVSTAADGSRRISTDQRSEALVGSRASVCASRAVSVEFLALKPDRREFSRLFLVRKEES